MTIQQMFFGAGGGSDGLYDFTTYTFNEPDHGKDGTPFSTLQSRYAGEPFLTSGNLVEGQYTGYHKLTMPKTGVYEFEAAGAPGSATTAGYDGTIHYGGRGIILKGRMSLNESDIIQFAIGKSGEGDFQGYVGGGGGGTFIVKDSFFTTSASDSNIILVAGGGAGGAYFTGSSITSSILDGSANTYGTGGQGGSYYGNGGQNGNGGDGRGYSGSSGPAGPAAGIYSAPTNFTHHGNRKMVAPTPFVSGNVGAEGYYERVSGGSTGHESGFGGSGSGGNYAGGPGGGYSGGGGGSGNNYSSGGGGSYTANLSNVSTVGYQGTGAIESPSGGYVKITFIG